MSDDVTIPTLFELFRPCPADVTVVTPDVGSYNIAVGVNALPACQLGPTFILSTPFTAPTLTVIVSLVNDDMVSAVLCAGSPTLGYVWLVAWLSASHVNDSLFTPMVIVLLVSSPCPALVSTKTPVKGL